MAVMAALERMREAWYMVGTSFRIFFQEFMEKKLSSDISIWY
jgi:hypothetical protein